MCMDSCTQQVVHIHMYVRLPVRFFATVHLFGTTYVHTVAYTYTYMHYTLHTYEPADGNGRAYFCFELVIRVGLEAHPRFGAICRMSVVHEN